MNDQQRITQYFERLLHKYDSYVVSSGNMVLSRKCSVSVSDKIYFKRIEGNENLTAIEALGVEFEDPKAFDKVEEEIRKTYVE